MNTIWSDYIQGVQTLYLSRNLRFHDRFSGRYLPLFQLDASAPLRILEIGCGPGSLAASLRRWYPSAAITALDRDSRFIGFARERIPEVSFLEGDAASLPFPDHSFDVVISHTLAEHMPPEAFYREQHRVLVPGGVCLVLTSRKTFQRIAPCLEPGEYEKQFWLRASEADDSIERFGVGKYWLREDQMPAVMESHGFRRVSTGYASIDLTPDSWDTAPSFAESMITAGRDSELENLKSLEDHFPSLFNETEYGRMGECIRSRYQTRLDQFRRGEKQWDTEVATILVLRGIK